MATSNARSREEREGESSVSAQVLYNRSHTSGIELFKHLSTLATAAVGVFFFALSTKVEPPLNADQRLTVIVALGFMMLTLFCGICGWLADGWFYESWARHVSGKEPETSWQTRERANLMRKTFAWLAIVSFLIGALAAVRYVYLRLAIVPAA
jgi:preprotein translocase subunit SecG